MVRGLKARWVTRYSVKNCWTKDANEGGRGAVALSMGHLRWDEGLELRRCHRHQLGYAGEIPVGVGYHRMAHVGGQRQHCLIDLHTLRVPEHHATNDEGVAKVMDTRASVSAAIDPAQLVAQADKDPMHLAQTQAMSQTLAPRTHEERRLIHHLNVTIAHAPVAQQRAYGARVQRHRVVIRMVGRARGGSNARTALGCSGTWRDLANLVR